MQTQEQVLISRSLLIRILSYVGEYSRRGVTFQEIEAGLLVRRSIHFLERVAMTRLFILSCGDLIKGAAILQKENVPDLSRRYSIPCPSRRFCTSSLSRRDAYNSPSPY